MEYYSAIIKKKIADYNNMGEPAVYNSWWNKSEKDKKLSIATYVWTLKDKKANITREKQIHGEQSSGEREGRNRMIEAQKK